MCTITLTGAEFVATVDAASSIISALNDQTILHTSDGRAGLINQLRVASQMLDIEQFCTSIQMLHAYENHVEGLVQAGSIAESDGALLLGGAAAAISAVRAIIAQSPNPNRC